MGCPASIGKLLITFGVGAKAEVYQFYLLSDRIYQNVIKLDITMYDIITMNVVQSRDYLF